MTTERRRYHNSNNAVLENGIENEPESEDPTTTRVTSSGSDIENYTWHSDGDVEGTPRIHNTGRISSQIREADSGEEEANHGSSRRDESVGSERDKL